MSTEEYRGGFPGGLVDGVRLTAFLALVEAFATVAFHVMFAGALVLMGAEIPATEVVAEIGRTLNTVMITSWVAYALDFGPNLGYLAWLLVAYTVGGGLAYALVYRAAPRLVDGVRRAAP